MLSPHLEATSLRSESLGSHHSVCRTTLLWKTGGHLFLPLGVSVGFQHALTCGHFPPFSAPMVTLPYLVSNFPLPPSSLENNNFYCFIKKIFFVSIWLCQVLVMTCRIKFPDQGSNLGPLPWELGILTTGPPEKSLPPLMKIYVTALR